MFTKLIDRAKSRSQARASRLALESMSDAALADIGLTRAGLAPLPARPAPARPVPAAVKGPLGMPLFFPALAQAA